MADNNDTEIEKCLYCPKTFTGLNNYNRDKHIESCKNKNGTPKGGNRNIMSFLKSSGSSNKKSPSVSLSLDISSPHYSIQNLFSPLSPAGTDCDSLDSWNQIQDLGRVPLESSKRKRIDLSSSDRSENTESSPSTLVESSEPYIVINESRYHKSNLVNSVLNNKTKLTGSRLLRVCEVKSTTKFDEVIEASEEQFRVSDTVAVVYKIKQTKGFVIIFVTF
jgi:hypothetical protein